MNEERNLLSWGWACGTHHSVRADKKRTETSGYRKTPPGGGLAVLKPTRAIV